MTAAHWEQVWPAVWADCAARDSTTSIDEALEALGVEVRQATGAVAYRQYQLRAATG